MVEAPSDTGFAHPVGDGVQIVVGEAEPGAHRVRLRHIEHRAGGGATAGEREQLGGHAEQLVRLSQRAVGQPDPQAVRGVSARGHVAETERCDDQRGVGLNVRAHHQDVARLQGRIVGEQTQQHLAQRLHLPGRTVAAVHLDGSVIVGERPGVATNRVGPDVGLQPAQKRVGFGCEV